MESKKYKFNKSSDLIFYSSCILIFISIIILHSIGFSPYLLGWISFSIAAYAVSGNDAVQTLGTFIESKSNVHWFRKTFVLGMVLCAVYTFGFFYNDGQIHFHRLDDFPETTKFNPIQLTAPIVLLIITRLRAPVSTTFLVLGLFGSEQITKMLTKSFIAYGLAFLGAILIYGILSKVDPLEYTEEYKQSEHKSSFWPRLQWFSTIYLWAAWIMQDTSNLAIYLPRKLNGWEFCISLGIFFLSVGLIFRSNGGTIQEIVSEKTDLSWPKAATIVDMIYGSFLILFQHISNTPISTTWLFLGLLAGREIILNIMTYQDQPYLDTFRKVMRDVQFAFFGMIVSVCIYFLASKIYH